MGMLDKFTKHLFDKALTCEAVSVVLHRIAITHQHDKLAARQMACNLATN